MELIRGLITRGYQRSSTMVSRVNQFNQIMSKRTCAMNVYSEGKMIVSFLSQEDADRMLIMSYSNFGFRLTNKLFVCGPIAIFPKQVYSWNVRDSTRVTPEATSLFHLLVPKVDIVIFGAGDPGRSIPIETRMFLQMHGINTESLPTRDAIATYNYLVDEGRHVAGAFIPPDNIDFSPADAFASYQTGYNAAMDWNDENDQWELERDYIYAQLQHHFLKYKNREITLDELREKTREIRKSARRTKADF